MVRGLVLYAGLLEGSLAVAMLLGTYVLLQVAPDPYLLLLGGCATCLVYLSERSAGTTPEDVYTCPERVAWMQHHRLWVMIVGGLAAVGAGIGLRTLRLETLLAGSVLGLVSLAYMLPVLPRQRRLKSFRWLKPLAISAAWACGGVVVPVLEAGEPVGVAVLLVAMYRVLFILPNVLLADWPDRVGDARAGLQTLAMDCPLSVLRQGATLCLGIALLGGGVAVGSAGRPWLWGLDLIGYGLMLGVVARVRVDSGRSYGRALDAVVAWPAVTALGAWLGTGW